jgi:hypothetical protein
MGFTYHNLIGGQNFSVVQVSPVDVRIGDGTLNPIGFTLSELNLMLVEVEIWTPTATAHDASGNDLTPEWWNSGGGAQLAGNALPNNNIWSGNPPTAGFIYPFSAGVSATAYFDIQEKYTISIGTGLDLSPAVAIGAATLAMLDCASSSQPIYFDGTLYYPPLIVNFYAGAFIAIGLYASTWDSLGGSTNSGTCTIMGKTCNIWWQDVPPNVGDTAFTLAIASRW